MKTTMKVFVMRLANFLVVHAPFLGPALDRMLHPFGICLGY